MQKQKNTGNVHVWAAETILSSLLVFQLYFNYISDQQRATRLLSLTVIDAVNFSQLFTVEKTKRIKFFPALNNKYSYYYVVEVFLKVKFGC